MAKKYVKELDKRREAIEVEHQMEKESLERAMLRTKRQKRVSALKVWISRRCNFHSF